MVIPAIQARDALKERLDAVFASDAFRELYPSAKAPKVYLGFPTNEPPFYVAVDEIADDPTTNGSASMGHAEVSFTVHVWLFAKHTDLKTAADSLISYADAVFASVLADQQLDMSVDNAFPSINGAGTASDSDKRYIAAATVDVTCAVGSVCPAEIQEVVRGANRNS